jgi:hypothetical protein
MLPKCKRVIIYGDSVILAGVQASLRSSPNLGVITLDKRSGRLEEELCDLCPAVVIFELGSDVASLPPAILHQPDLLLIGIDPETHKVMIWSGQQAAELSGQGLVQLILEGS